MRARLADQGEPPARPPWEARREDPLRSHSPGETSAGPSTPSEAVEPGEAGGDEGRQRRKRHQQRGKRPYRSPFSTLWGGLLKRVEGASCS